MKEKCPLLCAVNWPAGKDDGGWSAESVTGKLGQEQGGEELASQAEKEEEYGRLPCADNCDMQKEEPMVVGHDGQ